MFSPLSSEIQKQRRWKLPAIIAAIAIVVIFVLGEPVWAVYHHASSGKRFVEEAEKELSGGDLKAAALHLSLAHQEFLESREKMERLSWYRAIPGAGKQINALNNLLASASSLSGALSDLANIANTILSPLDAGLAQAEHAEKQESLKVLSRATPLLRETKNQLEQAQKDLDAVSELGLLPQISSTLGLMKEKLPLVQKTVDKLILASQVLPQMLGYPEEKTYLFLFQNNMELRPAGGFIGTYGILKLKNGGILSFVTDDVYNLDKEYDSKVPTPQPFQDYNKRFEWYFRDSNWSPDFPTAAEKAQWFYRLEGGPENVEGVIAITPTFIERILALTGPISVPDYPYEFTSENFSDQLEFHVEQNFYKFEEKAQRKNIIGDFGDILIAHALSLPKDKLLTLFNIVVEGFSEKHAFVYLNDSEMQKVISQSDWDGRVKAAARDYFLYVDCNLASLKSDPYVKRTIDYSVSWDGKNNPIARLTMTYNHTGEFNWRTTRYRTYARVYAPEGSALVKITGNESDVAVSEELGKTVFGFFKVTEPQTEESVTLEYKLPMRLAKQPYSLYAQKQAGTVRHQLNVNIDWNGRTAEWKTDLNEDREFQIN